jgi:hypothetical protein
MTTKAKEKQRQEKGLVNKYYKPTRHISWIEIIPKYISPKEAAALSPEEKEKLLKPFERPRPPFTRLSSSRQDKTLQTGLTRSRVNKQVPLLLPRSQTNP